MLSRTQAGPGRTVKQEQEEMSLNHVQTFISSSVCTYLVLVEVGGLTDEGGVGIAGACPEGGHPIQQGADLEFKGNIFTAK